MDKKLQAIVARLNSENAQFNGSIRALKSDDDAVRFEISVSSEDPYERWFGMEILGHKKAEVRMDWIASGNAPLLLQHNSDQLVGVIESAKIAGGRVTAIVRFGKSVFAQEIRQDVEDGIRRNVSVGYRVHEMKLVKGKADAPDEYRVTDWEPHEVSLVSNPADRTVGTNRAGEPPAPESTPPQKKEINMNLKERAIKMGLNEDASETAVLAAERAAFLAEGRKAADDAHKKELDRQTEIREIGTAHAAKIEGTDALVKAAIDGKTSISSFRAQILSAHADATLLVAPAAPAASRQDAKDLSGFRLVKAIEQHGRGELDGIELEMHQEGLKEAKAVGQAVKGLSIPEKLLHHRDLTVATEGTDLVQNTIQGGSFIDLLRAKLVLQTLGARILTGLTGDFKIPKLTAGATVAWEGENDAGSEQTPTTGQVAFSPNRVGCYVDISKSLLIQGSIDIEAMVRNDLMAALATGIETAAINGSGSNDQPTGILNTSGIGSVVGGTNGAAPTWAHVVELETKIATANADVNKLAYLTNPKVRGKLKTTSLAGTEAIMVFGNGPAPLNGYNAGITTLVPSNLTKGSAASVCSAIIFGNFDDLIIAQWGGLDLVVDPYTLATTNLTRVVMNAHADVGVRNAASFAAMVDALTT